MTAYSTGFMTQGTCTFTAIETVSYEYATLPLGKVTTRDVVSVLNVSSRDGLETFFWNVSVSSRS